MEVVCRNESTRVELTTNLGKPSAGRSTSCAQTLGCACVVVSGSHWSPDCDGHQRGDAGASLDTGSHVECGAADAACAGVVVSPPIPAFVSCRGRKALCLVRTGPAWSRRERNLSGMRPSLRCATRSSAVEGRGDRRVKGDCRGRTDAGDSPRHAQGGAARGSLEAAELSLDIARRGHHRGDDDLGDQRSVLLRCPIDLPDRVGRRGVVLLLQGKEGPSSISPSGRAILLEVLPESSWLGRLWHMPGVRGLLRHGRRSMGVAIPHHI